MAVEPVLSIMHVCISSNLDQLAIYKTSNRSARVKDIPHWNISDIIMKTISVSQINKKKHHLLSSKENE